MSWQGFLTTVVAPGSFAALLLGAVAFFLKDWISSRLSARLKHEYDSKIENIKADLKLEGERALATFKAEIDRHNEKLRISTSSFADVQKATIPRKIEAIDHLWLSVRSIKGLIPAEASVADYLPGESLRNLNSNNFEVALREGLWKMAPLDFASKLFGDADLSRPHLGEYTWAVFRSYGGLVYLCLAALKGVFPTSDRRFF